jgi:hypothetical protein
MKRMVMGACMSLAAFVAAGCVTDEAIETEASTPPPDTSDVDERPKGPDPLVVVEDDTGSVAWYPPALPGDELEVVITLRGTAAPILHPDFVQRVGAVSAYMALTAPGAPIPDSLLPHAGAAERAVLADETAVDALRKEAQAIRESIAADNARAEAEAEAEAKAAAEAGVYTPLASTGCTAGQKTAAKNAYGAAYSAGGGSSGSKTCGNDQAFHSTTGTVYYCNFGACDQDYTLALGQCGAFDTVDNDCTTVGGKTTALRARFQTGPGSGATFQHYGLRYAFAYYNCSDTYTAVMRRKRGNDAWIYTDIDPHSMQIRVGGGAIPAPYALAHTFGLGGTAWHEDHDWDHDTSQSPFNSMNMVAQTDGFMCGDIIQRFRTYDASAGSCNGGDRLCTSTPCSGDGLCFE